MRYGHAPGEIDAMPWREVQQFMHALPVIREHESPFSGGNDG